MREWVVAALVVVALCAAAVVAMTNPLVLPSWVGVATVPDAAMEPTYERGDVLVVVRRGAYETGDVVAYESTDGEQQVARVLSGDPGAGYVVAGDAVAQLAAGIAAHEGVLGRVWLEVPAGIAPVVRVVVGSPFLVLVAVVGLAAMAWNPAHIRRRRTAVDRRRRIRSRLRQPGFRPGEIAAPSGDGGGEGGSTGESAVDGGASPDT